MSEQYPDRYDYPYPMLTPHDDMRSMEAVREDVRLHKRLAVRATAGFLAVVVGLVGVHEARVGLTHVLNHGQAAVAPVHPDEQPVDNP